VPDLVPELNFASTREVEPYQLKNDQINTTFSLLNIIFSGLLRAPISFNNL
jgi:hypothetical protein